jgi:apolipoprotein N-acyltransferase
MARFPNWIKRPFLSRAQWRDLRAAVFWSAVSGLLLRLPFPPIEWGWIAFFGMAPFLAQLRGKMPKEAAWLGLVFGFCFFYPNLFWLNTLSSVNPFAPLGIIAAALICALAPALFAFLLALSIQRSNLSAQHSELSTQHSALTTQHSALSTQHCLLSTQHFLLVPALWTAIEYARSLTELGFPWVYLGHTQVNCLPLIQICDLTGVYGVSFLVVFANQALADTWNHLRSADGPRRRLLIKWVGVAAAGACILGYGFLQIHAGNLEAGKNADAPPDKASSLRVALIQTGVSQETKLASYNYEDQTGAEKMQADMNRSTLRQLLMLRDECRRNNESIPDVYVLPESAVTCPWFNLSTSLTLMVRDWATTAGAPLFFGADRMVPPPGVLDSKDPRFFGEAKFYNSAFIADPRTGLRKTAYDKMHLVPFGEYASYLDFIPGFTDYILGIGNFTPGEAPQTFTARGTTFGCVICFESCFSYLFRRYARLDVDWMAVVTNDAWYKLSSGARRHQTQAIFRAIEMRRPIVRVANTGISCIVDAWGRVSDTLPLSEAAPAQCIASFRLRYTPNSGERPRLTLYMRPWGEWFSWTCGLFAVGVLIAMRKKRARAFADTSAKDAKGLSPGQAKRSPGKQKQPRRKNAKP